MAPEKRARTAPAEAAAADTSVEVAGGDPATACSAMANMWRDEVLVDCEVHVEDRTFKAHRLVLCAASAYMNAAFCGELAEAESAQLTLKDMSSNVFEALLSWCYEGRTRIDEAILPEMLTAAGRLQIDLLQDEVERMIVTRLTPENCCAAWVLGDGLTRPRLIEASRNLALVSFAEASTTDGYRRLPVHALESLLASDDLSAPGEASVFQALKRWLEAQPSGTPNTYALARLIEQVRFPLMELEYVETHVNTDPLIEADRKHVIIMLKSYQRRPKPRAGADAFYVIGGYDAFSDDSNKVQIYRPQTRTWEFTTSMEQVRYGAGAAMVGGKLYVVGGFQGDDDDVESLRTMVVYDPSTRSWQDGTPMNEGRHGPAVAAIGGKLYVAGGESNDEYMSSMEIYDPETRAWSPAPPMSVPRQSPAAAAIGGKLYVAGGIAGSDQYLSSMQVYDPVTKTWEDAPPLPEPRTYAAVAVSAGKLYVVGGRSDNNDVCSCSKSLFVYDSMTRVWEEAPPMTVGRYSAVAAMVGGKLYVAGGRSGFVTAACMEVYDPETRVWQEGPSMQLAIAAAARMA